jgi:solute carrier family 25 citrate transporter 1
MTVSPIEHTLIGAAGGSLEVCIMQPTVAIKNALQEGRALPSSFGQLYRGLPVWLSLLPVSMHAGSVFSAHSSRMPLLACPTPPRAHVLVHKHAQMNVISIAPITASQFGTNRLMQQYLTGKADGKLTGFQNFASAAVAGAASSVISAPSELMIIQQQVRGLAPTVSLSHTLSPSLCLASTHSLAHTRMSRRRNTGARSPRRPEAIWISTGGALWGEAW